MQTALLLTKMKFLRADTVLTESACVCSARVVVLLSHEFSCTLVSFIMVKPSYTLSNIQSV